MESIAGQLNSESILSQGLLKQSKLGLKTDSAEQGANATGDVLGNFSEMLGKQMESINNLQAQANDATQTYATGGPIELHQVMIAVEKAETAMQLAVQVRNKLVTAYQEINRMQI